jgi:hypothetical protein
VRDSNQDFLVLARKMHSNVIVVVKQNLAKSVKNTEVF